MYLVGVTLDLTDIFLGGASGAESEDAEGDEGGGEDGAEGAEGAEGGDGGEGGDADGDGGASDSRRLQDIYGAKVIGPRGLSTSSGKPVWLGNASLMRLDLLTSIEEFGKSVSLSMSGLIRGNKKNRNHGKKSIKTKHNVRGYKHSHQS